MRIALPLIKKLIEDVRSVEHFEAVSVVPELLKNENIERAQFVEPLLKAYNAVKGHSNQVTVAMGYLGDSATPEIIGCISKGLAEKGYLRCKAAEAAGRIGEKAKSLAPELVKMLDSKDKEEVQAAIAALAKMKMNP